MPTDRSDDRRRARLTGAARLWRRTDAEGGAHLAGKLGALRVLVLENRGRRGEDDATHLLLIGAPASPPHDRDNR